jgi:hypothetical protein
MTSGLLIQMPSFNLKRVIQYKSQEVCGTLVPNIYHRVLATLNDDLYVLLGQSCAASDSVQAVDSNGNPEVTRVTDVVKATKFGVWIMSSFPCHFEHAF